MTNKEFTEALKALGVSKPAFCDWAAEQGVILTPNGLAARLRGKNTLPEWMCSHVQEWLQDPSKAPPPRGNRSTARRVG